MSIPNWGSHCIWIFDYSICTSNLNTKVHSSLVNISVDILHVYILYHCCWKSHWSQLEIRINTLPSVIPTSTFWLQSAIQTGVSGPWEEAPFVTISFPCLGLFNASLLKNLPNIVDPFCTMTRFFQSVTSVHFPL